MAYEALEDLEIFQLAEQICDRFYELTPSWKHFDQETIGIQLVRAADSIGANIAESYGRYHYGEKLNFLYYARGSLYETRYWVRRCRTRKLLPLDVCDNAEKALTNLGIKLNAYITDKRNRRSNPPSTNSKLAESSVAYKIETFVGEFIDEDDWLDDVNDQSPNHQSPNQLF